MLRTSNTLDFAACLRDIAGENHDEDRPKHVNVRSFGLAEGPGYVSAPDLAQAYLIAYGDLGAKTEQSFLELKRPELLEELPIVQLKNLRRQLALKNHPDLVREIDREEANRRMRVINERIDTAIAAQLARKTVK